MILTVTMNVALDRTVAVPRMRIGYRHRVVESKRAPGGKAVNVARTLKALGEPVVATGLAGGATGSRVRELLGNEDILHDFVEVDGESRTNVSIVDPTTGTQTEINERGPEVSAAEVERFRERLLYLAKGAQLCVIAGSLPPGAPFEVYAELIEGLRGEGVPVLLDADGEPMRAGLRAHPAVVAPNVTEAEEAVGHEFTEPDDVTMGLKGLLEMGAEEAIITTAEGCEAILGEAASRHHLRARIDRLEAVSAIGSGDAFLAGIAAARRSGWGDADTLAFAVACGAESTQRLGAGWLDPAAVHKLVDKVSVSELGAPIGVG